MATPKKIATGWRIQIEIAKQRDSKVFATKRECENWAAIRTAELRNDAKTGLSGNHTLLAALRKYATDVSPKNKGERWEVVRLTAFERQLPVSLPIQRITPEILSQWRDGRLLKVKPASVLREMKLLSSVFEVARREWRWIADNPLKDVRKPKDSPHRERIITFLETRKLLRLMGYTKTKPATALQSLAVCMLFSLSCGVRSGEAVQLPWEHVNKHPGNSGMFIYLPKTKNGHAREVPLSKVAIQLIERMRGYNDTRVFGLTDQQRDSWFRSCKDKADIQDLHWQDLRHSAATRVVAGGKIKVLELCKIFGWKNVNQIMTYFNPSVWDLAAKL